MIEIPFNISTPLGRELEYVSQAVSSGKIGGGHSFGRRCREAMEELMGSPAVLPTPSCTHALEMCSLLLELGPGDEVILPSFTFVSTANAFVLHGARPVFCDVRPDTLNMDEGELELLITSRTRAIVPVHYAGVGCEMDAILAIGARHGVSVVEDNAHGLFGEYRGRALGTLGRLATQSFHETKNLTCGEGGALVVNDPALVERAEIIRDKGTDRSRFFRGEVDRYTWRDLGSSYRMSDITAAFLLAQIETWPTIQERRKALWDGYMAGLADWAEDRNVGLPTVPDHCRQAFHMFFLLLPSLEAREALTAHLRNRGILAVFHYQPLHTSAMGRSLGGRPGDCPVTEDVSERLLRLPFYNTMTDDQHNRVVEAVREWPGP